MMDIFKKIKSKDKVQWHLYLGITIKDNGKIIWNLDMGSCIGQIKNIMVNGKKINRMELDK